MGHGLFEHFFQRSRRLVRTVTGGRAAIDLGRAVLVVAHGEFGSFTRGEFRQGGKRNHIALAVAYEELAEIVGVCPVISLGLEVHLPLPAEIVEVVDEETTHISLDRPVHVAQRYALLQDLVTIDIDKPLRHMRQEGR